MKTTEIRGRKIGSTCPACKKGRLCVVTHHVTGDNGIMGPSGHSWDYHKIERLACSGCSASFEVEKPFRGSHLENLIEEQLKGFKNPRQKPATCRTCRTKKLVGDTYFPPDPYDFRGARRRGHSVEEDEMKYLYCGTCCKVLWVEVIEKKKEDPFPCELADDGGSTEDLLRKLNASKPI